MSKIDITAREWNDIVFEGRNKNYGGYDLRGNSNKRHITALIIVLFVAVFGFYSPKLFKLIMPVGNGDKEVIDETTKLVDLNNPESEPEPEKQIEVQRLPELRKTVQFNTPIIVPEDQVTEVVTNDDVFDDTSAVANQTQDGIDDIHIDPTVTQIGDDVIEPDILYNMGNVQQQPSYPGGEEARLKFISENLNYPYTMLEEGIQGKVTIQFTVSKTGKLTNIQVVASTVPSVGEKEALRVVGLMPDWIAGKQNGKPVQVTYHLPIVFKIQNQ
ncbi:MAG: TonB family protein [Prevotellaceae bacterium]|jgi:protein TonB|nr:TonB family protein [Prevotellaceae bacterium]